MEKIKAIVALSSRLAQIQMGKDESFKRLSGYLSLNLISFTHGKIHLRLFCFSSFHIVQIQYNQTAVWFWGLIPIQVNSAFQFFSFGKPTKSPAAPLSSTTVLF